MFDGGVRVRLHLRLVPLRILLHRLRLLRILFHNGVWMLLLPNCSTSRVTRVVRVCLMDLCVELALERPQLRHEHRMHRRQVLRVKPRERLRRGRLRVPLVVVRPTRAVLRPRRAGVVLWGRDGTRRRYARRDALWPVRLRHDGARRASAEYRELVLLGLGTARAEYVSAEGLEALEVRSLSFLVELAQNGLCHGVSPLIAAEEANGEHVLRTSTLAHRAVPPVRTGRMRYGARLEPPEQSWSYHPG